MSRSIRTAALAAAFFTLALGALPTFAATVVTLRVMLHPYAAAPGELPAAAKAQLETAAGTTLTLTGTTRTGALELALPGPVSDAGAKTLVGKLRADRSVLWAEAIVRAPTARSVRAKAADSDPARRLLVRLNEGQSVTPDFLDRMSMLVGTKLSLVRQIGNVYVLETISDQSVATMRTMAELLQTQPEVKYVDPVRRATAFAVPDDPMYPLQWSLFSPKAGVNAETAWTLQPSTHDIVVAVVDTGILPHPDLDGRVLPGYDFISNAGRARDGNARDPDPRDEGDWSDGDCFGAQYGSSFHGTFVAGIIAAKTNNGIGIAGLAGNARILPVRVLGKCGGTFEDILEGVMWASGIPIAGVPDNKYPAKVINLSLGGFGACDQSLQEAIDAAMAQGAVIVAAAGNESIEAYDVIPANCSGVIAVGAHSAQGGLTSYSNFGARVDITAPGGDLPLTDLIWGLGNDGTTTPGGPSYHYSAGTSFSAPLVAGAAALLIARDGLITGGRVQNILAGTARNWPDSSQCIVPSVCGAGMLDVGVAVGSLLPGGGSPPSGAVPVIEYYRADLDHYFMTADPAEIANVDANPTFKRTGLYFYGWIDPATAPPEARPVCRFYADATVFIDSHYYSADFNECVSVINNWPGVWQLETANAFYALVPDAAGHCASGTLPIYRFFNNRRDASHRYAVDLSVRRAMINRAWTAEGKGLEAVAFCSPI